MKPLSDTPQDPAPDASVTLVYVGPEGHTSPELGPLVVGRRYQIAAALAAYLCSAHPDFWQLAATSKE